MKQIIYFLLYALPFFLNPNKVWAQKEAAIWYFGNYAGVDFGHTPPKAISNPQMATLEGCSSISDSTGTLLFYTDGRTVWNNLDSIVLNGTELKGDASSTHSSVIVKKPLSPAEYYILTTDAGGSLGVNYSLVNMDFNSGLGAVTLKNVLLVDASSEKIAVTRHKNDIYSWLVIPKGRSRAIYTYLVTENGIELKHIDSTLIGNQVAGYGQIKFSSDGKHLAFLSEGNTITVLDFDNLTGTLQKSQTIRGPSGSEIYGIEFSPSGKYIYVSTWFSKHKLCQCEVKNGTTDYTSDCLFYPASNVSGQLQLAPNQQIYVANNGYRYLSAISNPDSAFAQSGYIDSAIILLQGTNCNLGLPTFHSGYLNVEHIKVNDICQYDTAYYYFNPTKNFYDSLRWLVNGQPTADTTASGKQRFNTVGLFSISVVLYKNNTSDTFSRTIAVRALPILPNLMDTAVCSGDSFVCNTYRQPDILYLWSTGDTNAAITCFVPGTYSVKLTLNRCAITDSFTLQHNPYPVVNLPDDTVICQGTSTTLSAAQPGAFYLWSTGDTTASINLSTEQSYHVAVTSLGCTTTDTFVLRTTILPEITLGNDTTICEGQTLKLNADFPYSTYLWNNASTEALLKTYAAGTYTVMVTNVCGSVVDSIDIKTEVCDCFSWAPNAFTPNGDMTNDVFMPSLSCEYTAFDFRIYSKWGEEIFHSTSALNAWDGRYKGITVPADVYVWKLSCVLSNIAGKEFINDSNGTVTLLR